MYKNFSDGTRHASTCFTMASIRFSLLAKHDYWVGELRPSPLLCMCQQVCTMYVYIPTSGFCFLSPADIVFQPRRPGFGAVHSSHVSPDALELPSGVQGSEVLLLRFGGSFDCRTPDRQLGRCGPLLECDVMRQALLPLTTVRLRFLKKSICRFVGGKPLICCPSKPPRLQPTTSAPFVFEDQRRPPESPQTPPPPPPPSQPSAPPAAEPPAPSPALALGAEPSPGSSAAAGPGSTTAPGARTEAAPTAPVTDVSSEGGAAAPTAAVAGTLQSTPLSPAAVPPSAPERTAAPEVPTAAPTAAPTTEPTAAPTAEPTAAPTAAPTAVPTAEPTAAPTAAPTAVPEVTEPPTERPGPVSPPGLDVCGHKLVQRITGGREAQPSEYHKSQRIESLSRLGIEL